MYERHDRELIVVFTGPNGAGRRVIADMVGVTLRLKQVLSYTTRPKRPNENDGVDYWFVSPEAFAEVEAAGQFVEVMHIDGYRYGVKESDVRQQLRAYGGVYLILNRYGAEVLKRVYGDRVKRVFIYTDPDTAIARHKERGLPNEQIDRYMSHFEEEMAYRNACEHAYENIDTAHTMYDVTKALERYLERKLLELD